MIRPGLAPTMWTATVIEDYSMRAAHTPPISAIGPSAGRKPTFRIGVIGPSELKLPGSPCQDEPEPNHLAPADVARLNDEAVRANRMAKVTKGTLRTAWYRIKDKAISELLRHDDARVNSVEYSFTQGEEALLGISLTDGRELHSMASRLDAGAQEVIRRLLANQPSLSARVFAFVKFEEELGLAYAEAAE